MRAVTRDETLGTLGAAKPGPGTYVDGDTIKAKIDGTFEQAPDGTCTVTRERKEPPRTRRKRGATPGETHIPGTATSSRGEATHRHGVGKHGRAAGKKKKGRGDQGAWS